jgi:hypothetical protein
VLEVTEREQLPVADARGKTDFDDKDGDWVWQYPR